MWRARHRIPLRSVHAFINGEWLELPRQTNNQWTFYRSNGDWEVSVTFIFTLSVLVAMTASPAWPKPGRWGQSCD